jgi:hypothetical protein
MDSTKEPPLQAVELRLGTMGQFAFKTTIVSTAIVLSAWIMLDLLDDFASRRMRQLDATIRSATAIGGRQFWTKLEEELDKFADPRMDISAEKKRKILSQIKVISDRWRPVLTEAASSIGGDAHQIIPVLDQPAGEALPAAHP